MNTTARDPELQSLLDRTAVSDVLYRYASTIDVKDFSRLRTTFADDARGRYGDRPWIEGADDIVAWIAEQGATRAWQHHLVNVYHVDVDGDRAHALTYHTSYQTSLGEPDVANVIVARYHDDLVRTADGWKIAAKVMEVLWRETRHAPQPR
jgi:3-phenylpropionate/cinnamic acid dioxygenase small subunit